MDPLSETAHQAPSLLLSPSKTVLGTFPNGSRLNHLMKSVLTSAAFVLAASPLASAQTPVNANSVVELPSHAPVDGKADHETVAMNHRGDVFVVWSSSVFSLSGPDSVIRRVEGAFFRRTGATTWDLYPTEILGEADPIALPSGVSVYAAGDICRKADVVAVGNDFVVGWQRIENADTANGRIEVALIEAPVSGNANYHLMDASGIGWVLDSFDPRGAGGMLDLACQRGTSSPVAVAYAHRTNKFAIGPGDFAWDFDLRALTFDFPTAGLAPTVNTVNTLTSVPFDDLSASAVDRGRVLPDLVFDSWGNVVIAFEDFARGERISGSEPDFGQMHLNRYSVDAFGVFTEVNAQILLGSSTEFAQRRPNLFRSPWNDAVSIAWGEIQLPGSSIEIFHMDAVHPNAVDDPSFVDHAPSAVQNNIDPGVPTPLQYKTVRGVVITVDPNPGAYHAGYQLSNSPNWELLRDFEGKLPWRPALDVLESDPLRPGKGIVSLSFEGRDSTTLSRIFTEFLTI